ncbi:MAG: preprotein translocase subunit SecG [Planctomycetota bacterium]|nr:preprotein translocase subunit SecG [Planctomycetota bacterium]
MGVLFIIIFFLMSFFLVGLVLLQEGKGGGLTGMSTGMDGIMGAKNPLRRLTAYLFAFFLVLTVAINWYFHQRGEVTLPAGLALPESPIQLIEESGPPAIPAGAEESPPPAPPADLVPPDESAAPAGPGESAPGALNGTPAAPIRPPPADTPESSPSDQAPAAPAGPPPTGGGAVTAPGETPAAPANQREDTPNEPPSTEAAG